MEKMDANHDFSMYPEGRPQAPPSNPLAIVALVIAIVALPLSFLPVVGLIIALIALVLGIIAKGKARQGVGSGAAIGAIVASTVALLMSLVTSACTLLVVQGAKTMDRELKNQGIDLKEIVEELKSEEARERLTGLRQDLEEEVPASSAAGNTASDAAPTAASLREADQAATRELMMKQLLEKAGSKTMTPEEMEKVRALLQKEADARTKGSTSTPGDGSDKKGAAVPAESADLP